MENFQENSYAKNAKEVEGNVIIREQVLFT